MFEKCSTSFNLCDTFLKIKINWRRLICFVWFFSSIISLTIFFKKRSISTRKTLNNLRIIKRNRKIKKRRNFVKKKNRSFDRSFCRSFVENSLYDFDVFYRRRFRRRCVKILFIVSRFFVVCFHEILIDLKFYW